MKIHVTCSKDYDIYLEKGFLEKVRLVMPDQIGRAHV